MIELINLNFIFSSCIYPIIVPLRIRHMEHIIIKVVYYMKYSKNFASALFAVALLGSITFAFATGTPADTTSMTATKAPVKAIVSGTETIKTKTAKPAKTKGPKASTGKTVSGTKGKAVVK